MTPITEIFWEKHKLAVCLNMMKQESHIGQMHYKISPSKITFVMWKEEGVKKVVKLQYSALSDRVCV